MNQLSSPPSAPESPTGAQQLPVIFAIALVGWALMSLQEVLLFARPTPYGGPYVANWDRYFFYAVLFNLIGPLLAAIPVLIVCLVKYHRQLDPRIVRWTRGLTVGLVALVVMLDHADNEVMRFMGTHLSVHLVRTYHDVGAWGSDMRQIFAQDRGGPWLPFVVLAASPIILWLTARRVSHSVGSGSGWSPARALAALLLLLVTPLLVYNLPGGRFRRARVQPALLTLAGEWRHARRLGVPLPNLIALAREFQEHWTAERSDPSWMFVGGDEFPLLRAPGEVASDSTMPWNVIYLQLETFRSWNIGFLNPDSAGSPTPFLDSLSRGPNAAYWTRFLSFGPPTVSGFMAGHCSVMPHSELEISTSFTYTALTCLPTVLHAHGWHTAYFTGSDPDWDNQGLWLRRWYDETAFYRHADERDRIVFEAAAARIRELGKGGAPFFATVVSISNHYPFRSREPALDLTTSRAPADAIRNTMHYTDEVVRQFLTSLSAEPWFAHTVVVVVGDHGYNLGEHDGTPGQRNGWRESVWVPLLIVGSHPRLPKGRHDVVASLIDVAPTVTDLLGMRDTVPWIGHSLLRPLGAGRTVSGAYGTALFAERGPWSLVVDPRDGEPRLYAALDDPLQRRDLAREFPDTARALATRLHADQALVDFLLESNRVTPASADPRGRP